MAIAAAVVLAGALATTGPIGTNDIGFHLRIGREIAEMGAPPRIDHHSHTCPGVPYPDHEWLSQLSLYVFHTAFGDRGLAVLEGILVGLTLLLVVLSVQGPAVLRIALAITVLLLGIEHAEIRPHLLGWMMVALLAILLDRRRKAPVPELPVFVDGRIEVYRGKTLKDLFPEVRRLTIISPFGHRDRTQVAKAIEETQYLLAENPLFFGGHKILAFLLLRNGDLAGARASLRRNLDLHPEGIKTAETRSIIERLREQGAWP